MDTHLDKMVSNLSSNVKKEVAKYIHMCNRKNEVVLNQLPLVKSLRKQLAKYQNNYVDEMETLRKRIVILEAKQKEQVCLCTARADKTMSGGEIVYSNLQWAPRCNVRKTFACDGDHNNPEQLSWPSYEDAKKCASEMTNKDKKIWLQWATLVLPENIPPNPQMVYQEDGWISWHDFIGLRDNRVSLTVTEMVNDEVGGLDKDIKNVTMDTTKNLLSAHSEEYSQKNVKEGEEEDEEDEEEGEEEDEEGEEDEEDEEDEEEDEEDEEEGEEEGEEGEEDEEDEEEGEEGEEDEEDEEEGEGGNELDEACWNNGVFMGSRGTVSSEIADCDQGPSGDEGSVSAIAELLSSARNLPQKSEGEEEASDGEEEEEEAVVAEASDEEEEAETGEEEASDEEDEELEVDEWWFGSSRYYVTDSANGRLFEYLEGGDIGEEIGYIKKSKVFFS